MTRIDELKKLNNLTKLKSVEVLNAYEDDHCLCMDASINGIKIEFLWYDFEVISTLNKWKDNAAAIIEMVKDCVHMEVMDICGESIEKNEVNDYLSKCHEKPKTPEVRVGSLVYVKPSDRTGRVIPTKECFAGNVTVQYADGNIWVWPFKCIEVIEESD